MEQSKITRRDFLKLAAGLFALPITGPADKALFLGAEMSQTPSPLTDLLVLRTDNTPFEIVYLDRFGQPDYDIPAEHKTLNDILIDVPLTHLKRQLPLIKKDIILDSPKPEVKLPLPHMTGTPQDFYITLDWDTLVRGNGKYGMLLDKKSSDIISTYAYSDRNGISPNKLWNVLTGLSAIVRWQKENGPMKEGYIYSFLSSTGITKRAYLDYQPNISYAGGVCAIVSVLSKARFLAGECGAAEEVYRALHKPAVQYWANPLDPGITKANSDASTSFEIGSEPSNPINVDYRFRTLDEPIYLSVKAFCEHDEKPTRAHQDKPSDARLSFSITFQRMPPDNDEYERLRKTLDDYAHFHGYGDYDLNRIHRKD